MRPSSLRIAFLVLLSVVASFTRAADHVSVWLDPTDHAVHVAYHFAPGTFLQFTGEQEWQRSVRDKWWKRDEQCFQLERNGLRLGTAGRCASASIRLDWDERDRPRMYPALVRMRNGGALVYAGYIEVFAADGKTPAEIRLEAPRNGVASFRDRKSAAGIVLDSSTFGDDVSGWLYLGPDRFEDGSAARVLADDGVPPELRRIVVDIAPRLMELYGRRLGVPYPTRPTFYFNWNARDQAMRGWQADVVPGGDVRFGVTGSAWRNAGPDDADAIAYSAAHELAHLWNANVFHRPEWASAWLHEGNAELLSTAALLDLGQIDASQAADRVSAAAMECKLYARSRAWKDMKERERDRVPYACGFAFQFAIVAAARRERANLDVFEYWRQLWAKHPTYYEAVVIQDAAEHHEEALAQLLRETLTGSLPVDEALRRLLDLGGFRYEVSRPLGPTSRVIASRMIMSNVMRLDCRDHANYVDYGGQFEVVDNGSQRACANLMNGMHVANFEGLDVMTDPAEIARRIESNCAKGEPVTVSARDGRSVRIPCSAHALHRAAFDAIELDPGQVAAVLGASSQRP